MDEAIRLQTPEARPFFAGWIRRRPRGPWRLFCRARTEQEVLTILLRDAPAGVDKLLRLDDGDPNDKPVRAPQLKRRLSKR